MVKAWPGARCFHSRKHLALSAHNRRATHLLKMMDKHHLHHKFGIGEHDMCPCNTEPMTADHVLIKMPMLFFHILPIYSQITHIQYHSLHKIGESLQLVTTANASLSNVIRSTLDDWQPSIQLQLIPIYIADIK
jgi:hypothetical protein